MNRIYRLVWNRTLRVLQVASEFARAPHGGSSDQAGGVSTLRRQPLAHACAVALALGLVITSTPVLAGVNGGNGSVGTATGGSGAAGGAGSSPGVNGGGNGGQTYTSSGGTGGGAAGSGGTGGAGGDGHGGAGSGAGGTGGVSAGGGKGGNGAAAPGPNFFYGGGGGGGAGGGLNTSGIGAGGGGGGYYGGGGGGGAGVGLSVGSNSTNATAVSGGNGGNGGDGSADTLQYFNGGGAGGGGGAGAIIGAGFSLGNNGTITGGNGGNGGAGALPPSGIDGGGTGGAGGGGAGVLMSINASLTNTGSISGGNGGIGAAAGAGGVGIFAGGNNTITNSGTISGGLTGGSGAQADAIEFAGTGNTLNLQTGSIIHGALELDAGAAATIAAQNSGLTLSNAIELDSNSSAMTADTSTNSLTMSGVISGAGSLNQSGAGVLTLTGNNIYTGGSTITAGTLQIGNGGTTGSIVGNVNDNGTLAFSHSDNVVFAGVVSGTGAVNQLGNGVLTLTGSNTYTGGTTITAGMLQIGNGGTAGSITGNVSDTGTLAFNHSDNVGFAGVVSGTGALNQLGNGVLTLTGSNTYTGGTTITAGTLQIGNGGITGSITGNVLNNSSLVFDNSGTTTLNGVISGSGQVGVAAGNLWLTGANTYAGDTTVNGATLHLGNGGTSGSILGNVVMSNGVLDFNRSDNVTFGGTISGSGAVEVFGTGTATLTGNNSYSGATIIGNGTLALSGSGSIASSSSVSNSSIFDISNTTSGASITSLSGSGTVNLGAQTLTLTGAQDSFSGVIDGSGGLTVTGGTEILYGDNTYTGGTTIAANAGLIIGGNSNGSIVGNVTDNGLLVFNRTDSFTFAGDIDGSGSLELQTPGTLILTGTNTHTGGTQIDSGVVQVGNGGTTGTLAGDVSDNGSLVFDRSDSASFGGSVSGSGSLVQLGAGNLTLTGDNTYSGGTTISNGSLQLGNGGTSGSIGGNVVNNSSVVFDRSDSVTFAGVISGTGSLSQNGSGILVLNGANSYSGGTTVANGSLLVGDSAHPGASIAGDVNVDAGAMLGGHGTIGGNVDVANGAHLSPGGSIGTLTVDGDLTVAQGGILDYEFGAPGTGFSTPGTGDQTSVGGNLTLNGAILNVNADTGFGPGLYNVFSYGGALTETNGGITLGSVPTGTTINIQTLTASKQINLLNTTGSTLNFWNGNGLASSSQMGGGSGTWSVTSLNWTNANGDITAALQPQPGFGIFGGASGTVTVDGSAGAVTVTGMQFASDGYALNGDTLTLVADGGGNAPTIRVGDGTTNGASDVAQIDNALAGTAGLVKSDFGTLILAGDNTYTGGTTISAGTLQLGNGGITGSVQGDITDNGTLAFDRSDDLSFGNAISGNGNLIQLGNNVLTLSGSNTYTGLTTINAGTLALSGGGSIADSSGVVDNGTLDISGTIGGAAITSLSGSGAVNLGTQMLTLTHATDTFSGAIAGNGGLAVIGGVETLTGTNTYTGSTLVDGGTLAIKNGGSIADTSFVLVNGTLNVDGNGSSIAATSGGTPFLVGSNGSGTLTASNGATVSSQGEFNIGLNAGDAGAVTIASGAALTVAYSMNIGKYGSGTLTVSNGGTVDIVNGFFSIGDAAGSNGAVTVTGNGSTVTESGGQVAVGNHDATGTLTIADGGRVTGDSVVIANDFGSIGTLNIGAAAGATAVAAGTLDTGNVYFGSGTGMLVFNHTDAGYVFAPAISGAGTVEALAGTTILTGESTYTGGTTIGGGTLQIGNGGTSGSITGDITDNAALAFDHSDDVNFNGIISGSGSLTQAGTGKLILTGANTYAGGTTIGGGTLQIGNGGTSGSITGDITDNTALAFDHSDDMSFNGVISGSGSLTQAGTGKLILTGTNTYAGGTTISVGTLQIGNGGTSGSITGDVTDNGTITFAHSDTVTFGNIIRGTGRLSQAGGGMLFLTGANAYSGGTSLDTGTLSLGNASAIGTGTLAMAANTSLDFSSSFMLANAITLSGDPTINVGAGLNTTLSGGISDGTQAGDLVKTGAGSLILTGVDTYTGGTEVAAGTLDVRGSLISSVSVDSGATLTGTGSTGGMAIAGGATVTPGGNAIGTLTVNGNLSIDSGASYHVDATDTDSSDLIHATGTATLAGGSVVALAAGSNWAASTRYIIVSADNGISGNFGTASSNFAFLTPTLSYDANHAYLTLARNATTFPSVGITANQVQTASAVEALGPTNALYNTVLPLAAAPARAAFNELADDSLASTRTAIIDDSHYVRDAINSHLQGVQSAGGISQNNAQGSAWASAWGHGGNHDSDSNAAAMRGNGSGLLVGADRDLGAWRVGAVAGLGQLSDRTDGAANAHSTATVVGLYSGVDLGAWQLQGGVAHSWYQTDSHRAIATAGIAGVATARYRNGVTQAYVDGGYRFQLARGNLTPYLNLARVSMHQGAISESGNPAALQVQANTSDVNYGTVGLRGVFDSTSGTQLYASLGFQHAWGDLSAVNRQTFVQGGTTGFSVTGLPVAMNAGLLDLGIRFNVASNVTVDAGYHGQFASDAADQGARMALNISF